jgi:hypothetical protein
VTLRVSCFQQSGTLPARSLLKHVVPTSERLAELSLAKTLNGCRINKLQARLEIAWLRRHSRYDHEDSAYPR